MLIKILTVTVGTTISSNKGYRWWVWISWEISRTFIIWKLSIYAMLHMYYMFKNLICSILRGWCIWNSQKFKIVAHFMNFLKRTYFGYRWIVFKYFFKYTCMIYYWKVVDYSFKKTIIYIYFWITWQVLNYCLSH